MSILRVARMGNPILRQCAKYVNINQIVTSKFQKLVDNMVDTMSDYGGIGIAAPQVNESLQIIVLGIENNKNTAENVPFTILFNPELIYSSKEKNSDWEGCLSIPNIRGMVDRSIEIHVTGYDRRGDNVTIEAHNYFARVLQHEMDHLQGTLFIDRMLDMKTLCFVEEHERYWIQDNVIS